MPEAELQQERIRVSGQVQGVGYRPWVWRLARELGLSGNVRNVPEGVVIEASGSVEGLDALVHRLQSTGPPMAEVESLCREVLAPPSAPVSGFTIAPSSAAGHGARIIPDIASCVECLAELQAGENRRHRYPFISCSHCGPRLSIVERLPWDRDSTTMQPFTLCASCATEYADPSDRRFHAQTNACPDCGPQLWLRSPDGRDLAGGEAALQAAISSLAEGGIVALKSTGGWQLACDASRADSIARLRAGKHRPHKAFALLARDLDVVRRYARVSAAEAAALTGPAAPIVLLAAAGEKLPRLIAPGLDRLGLMLPHSPLQHLLLEPFDVPLVMTSGNVSGEPQLIDDEAALALLAGVADLFLGHDRGISQRVDDAVVCCDEDGPRLLRGGRGIAPLSLALPQALSTGSALALGAHMKNTFALADAGRITLSQHIGDLDSARSRDELARAVDLYRGLLRQSPARIVTDLHPDYATTRLGQALARQGKVPCVGVQHHHAHMAAVLLEHAWPHAGSPVLGVILDGLGYGEDGAIWGGEFLLGGYRQVARVASFKPVALPGGNAALREPWRNTFAHLRATFGWPAPGAGLPALELLDFLATKPLDALCSLADQPALSPPASSCGRLFDAVAAACGICRERVSYEGQAAMELEAVVDEAGLARTDAYPFQIDSGAGPAPSLVDPAPMWRALLADLDRDVPVGIIAARFHCGLAGAIAQMVYRLRGGSGGARFNSVVLSGGVFQNQLLSRLVQQELADGGLDPLFARRLPAGDGGIAAGQLAIALARDLDEQGAD